MKNVLSISKICFAMVIALSAVSCQYKELDVDDALPKTPATFIYDYSLLSFEPGMMRLIITPMEGQFTSPMLRDFKDSLAINLPYGQYKIVSFNNDSEKLYYSGMYSLTDRPAILSSAASASKYGIKSSRTGDVYYDYPDRVAIASDTIKVVNRKGINENIFVIRPVEITKGITIEVRGIKNLTLLHEAKFLLDNCSVEYYPVEGTVGNEKGTVVSTDFDIDLSSGEVSTDFYVFGLTPETKHLDLILSGNGFSNTLTFDLDGRIQYDEATGRILILLETDFDLADVAPKGSFFDMHVDEWETDSVDVNL